MQIGLGISVCLKSLSREYLLTKQYVPSGIDYWPIVCSILLFHYRLISILNILEHGIFMEFIVLAVESLFSEVFSMWVLLALVFILIGLFLVVAMVYMHLFGVRVPGTVLGAINQKRVKKKVRDGQEVERIKRTLYPVFEYTMPNGEVFTSLSSEGGTGTLKYTTGQEVNLIVSAGKEFHDVYDASNYAVFVIGFMFIAAGIGIIYGVGQLYSAFGIGLISLGIGIVFLIYRIVTDKKDTLLKKGNLNKDHKKFNMQDVKPVESFKT